MFRRRLLRTFALLVLSLVLTTPLCEAASRGRASRTSPASVYLLSVWEWAASLWAKNGCSLDPGGLCATNPTSHPLVPVPSGSNLDAGCSIDPGGRTTCGGHS
jgi:hypothetical protein